MRPVLLRIHLNAVWDLGPLGQWPVFGFGVLFGVWLAVGLFLWFRSRRAPSDSASSPPADDWLSLGIRGAANVIAVITSEEPKLGEISNRRQRSPSASTSSPPVGDWLTFVFLGAAIVMAPTIGARFGPNPSIPIFGYGFMMCLGFLSATMLAARRATHAGFPPETIWDLTMYLLISGVGGARLFYLIQHGDRVFAKVQTPIDFLKAVFNLPDGGLVLYGGLIAGTLAFWYFCRSRQLAIWKLADLLVPSVFLGIAFGRLGCFLYGCCFGDRCELPWAVEFPAGSVPFNVQVDRGFLAEDAVASLPIHPTQLYSVVDGILLCLLTLAYYPVRARDGSVVTLALLTYPLTRFLIERLRGDEMGQFGTSLTIAQWISLGMWAAGIGLALVRPPTWRRSPG